MGVAEKVVTLVRENDFFERNSARPELARQHQRLGERDVVVVVAMDQQHGRAPSLDGRHWRSQPLHLPNLHLRIG